MNNNNNNNDGKSISSDKDPIFIHSLIRLRSGKKDLTTSREGHNCCQATCNPQSEYQMICQGSLLGMPVTSNVFLCKFGQIHICTENGCKLYLSAQNHACPISGFQFGLNLSSYSSGDYRTWRNPTAAKQADVTYTGGDARMLLSQSGASVVVASAPIASQEKGKKVTRIYYTKKIPLDQVCDRADKMVYLLLYSPTRKRVIENMLQQNQERGTEAQLTYIRNVRLQEQQLPYYTDLYRLKGYWSSKPVALTEFAVNEDAKAYYVSVISQIWHKVLKFYISAKDKRYDPITKSEIVPRIDFDAICLGTLYGMRMGMQKNGLVILPRDEFLRNNLPTINDLSLFGNVEKSLITKGDKLISTSFDNAIADQVPVNEIVLSMDQFEKRVEEKIIKEENLAVPVKISSNGEKLFMPVSRLKKKPKK